MAKVMIDFVAYNEARDTCILALIEEGPWKSAIEVHLARLQDRLYGCLDAALDGQLAERFPDSAGKALLIRVDCYDVPRDAVDAFMERFSTGIRSLPDYSAELSPFIASYAFELNHDSLRPSQS